MSRNQILLMIVALLGCAAGVRADNPIRSVPAVKVDQVEAIPLRPRGTGPSVTPAGSTPAPTTGRSMTTVVGGLAVCLGIFFLLVWVTKRHAPAGLAPLPKEVVESLGRAPFSGRQHLQLLRVGRKLVLLHVTPTGTETLTEIVDAAEVDRLVGLCQQSKPTSVTTSFREVLTHYESEPAAKGFLGDPRQTDWELATHVGRKRPTRQEEIDG